MILLIILLILIFGGLSLPVYSYSAPWGYGPSGVLGFVLVVILILLLLGRL